MTGPLSLSLNLLTCWWFSGPVINMTFSWDPVIIAVAYGFAYSTKVPFVSEVMMVLTIPSQLVVSVIFCSEGRIKRCTGG